jgi:hypothetical protein
MTNNHFKTTKPTEIDLKRDSGIGQSKGLNRFSGADDISGENTDEGDVGNETNRFGGVDPDHLGRTNK